MREYWKEFMEYLKENDDWIEPIVYTTAMHPYTNHLLKLVDPEGEVFKHSLY